MTQPSASPAVPEATPPPADLTARVTALEVRVMALEAAAALAEKKRAWMMAQMQSHRGGYAPLPTEPDPYP